MSTSTDSPGGEAAPTTTPTTTPATTLVADPSWRGLMTRVYDVAWITCLLTTAILLRRAAGRAREDVRSAGC